MSKRQSTLFKRMKSAKESLTKTENELNRMLLNELHRNGVYTLDQFHEAYSIKPSWERTLNRK